MENNNNYEIKQSATIARILKSSDYFEILGVKRKATNDEIKKRFRELSKMVHPDKCSHPNSTQAFQQLQKASETLLDETKKSVYIKILITVNNGDSFAQKQIKTIERVLKCNNYYDILKVSVDATEFEIEIEFEKLKRLIHPDKCRVPNSEQAFERVWKAYEVLCDSDQRHKYDQKFLKKDLNQRKSDSNNNRRNTGQQTYKQNSQKTSSYWIKILIFALIFLMIALFLFNPSTPYSLHRTVEFSNLRKTSSSKLSYFVDDDFEERFSKQKIEEIESEIERKHNKFSNVSPLYSLSKTPLHSIARKTSSMKINYFVGDDFHKRFTLNKIEEIESKIEAEYVMELKFKCRQESQDPVYRDLIQKAKKLSGKIRERKEENAKKLMLPSCILLENLSEY